MQKKNHNLWKYHKYNLPVSIFDTSANTDVWDGKVIWWESSEAGKQNKTEILFSIIWTYRLNRFQPITKEIATSDRKKISNAHGMNFLIRMCEDALVMQMMKRLLQEIWRNIQILQTEKYEKR